METKTIESSAIWYHISSATGDSASRWIRGAARKGRREGKEALSAVLFDLAEITEAIGDDRLLGAEMTLRRDASYGTDAVRVSIAPAMIDELSEQYMSTSQCRDLAMRGLHKNQTIYGDVATFALPGAMLRALKAGRANAFLLYKEEDGSESYCRMAESATLKLYVGEGWKDPVWTRNVVAGNVISSNIYSHVEELREIEYYINLKRDELGLLTMTDIGTILLPDNVTQALGTFAGWKAIITALQGGLEDTLQDEPVWPVPEDEALPRADIVENLRSTLGGGEGSSLTPFRGYQQKAGIRDQFSEIINMDWESDGEAYAGKIQTSINIRPGQTIMGWRINVCGWLFQILSPSSIMSAAVDLTIKESAAERPFVKLYGIKTQQALTNEKYNQVFGSEEIGSGYCNIGEPTRIHISAAGVEQLKAENIYGVGIRYDNTYVVIDKADLRIVYGTND